MTDFRHCESVVRDPDESSGSGRELVEEDAGI